MPFRIQRVPRGLNDLLTIFGGATPIELEERVRTTLDLTQYYGLTSQRVIFRNDPVLAEAAFLTAVPAAELALRNKFVMLYGASFGGIKTATMTAFRVSLEMSRCGQAGSITLATGELGPFGATETGAAGVAFVAPYPMLLIPPWDVFGRLQILGTDANANCTCIAEIGVLT